MSCLTNTVTWTSANLTSPSGTLFLRFDSPVALLPSDLTVTIGGNPVPAIKVGFNSMEYNPAANIGNLIAPGSVSYSVTFNTALQLNNSRIEIFGSGVPFAVSNSLSHQITVGVPPPPPPPPTLAITDNNYGQPTKDFSIPVGTTLTNTVSWTATNLQGKSGFLFIRFDTLPQVELLPADLTVIFGGNPVPAIKTGFNSMEYNPVANITDLGTGGSISYSVTFNKAFQLSNSRIEIFALVQPFTVSNSLSHQITLLIPVPVVPGAIQGTKFDDLDGNGLKDPSEPGLAGVTICSSPAPGCTVTDVNGNYSFTGLAPGNYTVSEFVPFGRVNTTPIFQTVAVVSGQTTVGVNFGNRVIAPPPPDVQIVSQAGTTTNNTPTQSRFTNLVIRKTISVCSPVNPPKVTLTWPDGTVRTGNMVNLGGNLWEAVFTPPFPGGTATMRIDIDCPPDTPGYPENPASIGGEDAFQIGNIVFLDPSGTIKNACTNQPIQGVTATLLKELPSGSGTFVVPSTADHLPATNPQTTGADGRYAWVVVPGTYKVRAEKSGFETGETAPVIIPPAVTNLDISLTPVGGCAAADTTPPITTATTSPVPNANGWNNTNVTVTLTCTDAIAGCEATEFSLDGAGFAPYPGPISISTEGVHTFLFRSRDKAGNVENSKSLTIRIDKTPPTVTKTLSPAAGPEGWVDSDGAPVTATWSGTDALSGIASCDQPTVLASGGVHTVTGSCVDLAGNVSIHTQVVKIVVKVPVDIKPGSDPNSINLKSRGNIPVGVKTGPTHGVAFDATAIVRSTVRFAGAVALPIGQSPEDFDGDGDLDMVYHFRTQDTNLTTSSTQGCLTGETSAAVRFKGCDSVRVVP